MLVQRGSFCALLALLVVPALGCQAVLGLGDYSFEGAGGSGAAGAGVGGSTTGYAGQGAGGDAYAGAGGDAAGAAGAGGTPGIAGGSGGTGGTMAVDHPGGAAGAPPDGGPPPELTPALAFTHYSFARATAPYSVSAEVGLLERLPEVASVLAGNVTTERGGTVEIHSDGSFSYAPASTLVWGDDRFVFADADGADAGLVRISLQPGLVRGLNSQEEVGHGYAVSGPQRVVDDSSERYTGEDLDRAGDVNGDGLDDFIVSGGGLSRAFVVFGKRDGAMLVLPTIFEQMDPSDGFVIDYGAIGGSAVAGAGDVNGDGFDDVVIGTPSSRDYAAFIVFGGEASEPITLADPPGARAAVIRIYRNDTGTDPSGVGSFASAAGDVNGDGFDDIILGGNDLVFGDGIAASYVIFGAAALESVTLLHSFSEAFQDPDKGFEIRGDGTSGGVAGGSVARGAGDVNGDGLADLVIGSPGFQSNPARQDGMVFVVFGKENDAPVSTANIAAGVGGFAILGPAADDGFANAVSGAGDVNGDGLADVVIGASRTAGPDLEPDYGAAYVVFGKSGGAPVSIPSLGEGGFAVTSPYRSGGIGNSVGGGGDFNGDGLADVILGSMTAGVLDQAGAGFLIFGKKASASVSLDSLEAGQLQGVAFTGTNSQRTFVASGGDANHDGLSDLLVAGAWSDAFVGRVYVLFGWDASDRLQSRRGLLAGGRGDDTLDYAGTPLVAIRGGYGFDTLRFAGGGLSLDLRRGAVGAPSVDGIEHIDLRGEGADILWLDDAAVRRLPGNRSGLPGGLARTLVLSGNAGDQVVLDLTGYSAGPSNAGREVWIRDGGVYGVEAPPGLIVAP